MKFNQKSSSYKNFKKELKKAFDTIYFYVPPGKQTLDVWTNNQVLFLKKWHGPLKKNTFFMYVFTYKMGNFCKIFKKKLFPLDGEKGKLPLKRRHCLLGGPYWQ